MQVVRRDRGLVLRLRGELLVLLCACSPRFHPRLAPSNLVCVRSAAEGAVVREESPNDGRSALLDTSEPRLRDV